MLFDFMNGNLSYDAATALANVNQHKLLLMLAGTLPNLGGFLQTICAIWIGFKHRSHGIPLLCVTWFFAHDLTFFLNYTYWFHETDSWMAQMQWYQMGVFVILELILFYQILHFSRAEVFPGMSYAAALASLLGMQAFAFALFWWFMSLIDDPHYFIKMATTSVVSPLLLIPMMRARGSRKGFNLPSIGGVALLAFTIWPLLWIVEPAYFGQPLLIAVALGNMAMAAVCVWYWYKLPPYRAAA